MTQAAVSSSSNSSSLNSETETIESWFFNHSVKSENCSLEPRSGLETCPGYYKALAAAADWHVVTIGFSVMLIFMFIGMALKDKE